jgi:hypothetical protein
MREKTKKQMYARARDHDQFRAFFLPEMGFLKVTSGLRWWFHFCNCNRRAMVL